MKDSDFIEQRDRVSQYFLRWIPVLGFNHWRLVFQFLRTEQERDERQRALNAVTLLQTDPKWEYEHARFTVFLSTIQRLIPEDDDLEWHVVHELTHLWLNELHDADHHPSPDLWLHEERVCSRITTAILATRDAVCAAPTTWARETGKAEPAIVYGEEDSDGDCEATYSVGLQSAQNVVKRAKSDGSGAPAGKRA